MKKSIIIMAKVPRAGNVKTRLQPFLSPEQCRSLSEAFLEDAISKVSDSRADKKLIFFLPVQERDYFTEFEIDGFTLKEQTGENLGDKMFNAFEFAFGSNSDAVVMIGTDSPTFPSAFIERAFEFLKDNDAVLGKTADGGFYLIGLRILDKEIFANVAWSSSETFQDTTRNMEKLDLKVAFLPDWFDVDLPEDLKRLKNDLISDFSVARATRLWFRDNF